MTDKPDEIKVSIKVTNFDCNPGQITKILDLKPTKTWLKGDLVHPKAINTHKENGWMFQLQISTDTPFRQQMQTLLDLAIPKKQLFLNLPNDAEIEINCVVYSIHGRPDISLSSAMIKAVGEINAAIDFDLYQLPSE